MPDVSAIVVNWNVRDLLRQCLASVRDGAGALDVEAIVVDNASTDGSADMVRTEFSEVALIANQDNPGFAAANNQGLEMARGRYAFLLNPDAQVMNDALAIMTAYMDEHPDVGLLGPMLRYGDGSLQSSRRRFPTLATALVESTVLEQWLPNAGPIRRYRMLDTPDDAVQDVDWVVGAAMFARREAIEQVGPLDDGYFMYSEELDWGRRFKAAGWRVVYLPTALVIHHEGRSSEQNLATRDIRFHTSRVRYFNKYHGAFQAEVVRWFTLATFAYQLGREGVKWLAGHKRPLRAARVRAYAQVLRSGLRG
ncbi:MAG: glycosyltransferase family 2 protein [Chloroflexi bacterium]|nr:glycosyltransferase family 2 protein [Chloroflexota bacterium]MBU1748028.1 glycosyltransferase family 2 protein [Chloroflexota bacterium]MBU1878536.1 glycosyltransferase family 2 protein [Chloroflexota bacterium]